MKTVIYESLSEFLAAAEADPSEHKASHQPGVSEWSGGVSFAEAARLARVGWPEGAARVASIAAEVTADIGGEVSRELAAVTYDVAGLWVDVGRLATGEPECCAVEYHPDAARVTKIVVNVSANARVRPTDMIKAGAAVAAAIDAHESTGRRCEVWIASGSKRSGGGELQVLVLVKPADQHLDLDRLAFLVSPAATILLGRARPRLSAGDLLDVADRDRRRSRDSGGQARRQRR
jgi:hypothetical protein